MSALAAMGAESGAECRATVDRAVRAAARRGMRDMAGIVVAYIPLGLAVGGGVAAGPTVTARWVATLLVYGGGAQVVLLQGLDGGAPVILAVMAALAVNLRLLAYSTSLAPVWRSQPRWFRWVAAAMVIDPTWVLAHRDHADGADAPSHRSYVLAAGATLTVGFLAEVSAGVLLSDRLGLGGHATLLALALPVNLMVMVAPRLSERHLVPAITLGAGAGWWAADLPPGVGLVIAVVGGAVLGAIVRPAAGGVDLDAAVAS